MTAAPPDILRFFDFRHLSGTLREVSALCCDLAHTLEEILPDGPEKSVALRKILEAKDAAVRAAL
mgnify:CR=1 FL=1